jgi:hypothetical protein
MGPQIAFVICVIVPVLMIGGPLLLAHRRERRAKAAQLAGPEVDRPAS